MRGWRPTWLLLVACVVAVGCGDDDDDGNRFGDATALRDYRAALNPIVDVVSAVETEVQERAVGSSNVATAANLNAVYNELRPSLLEALVDLDRLTPPRQLQDLHGQIRQLVVLRLDAYRIVMAGYAVGDTTVYAQAESNLHAANDLIIDINLGLCEIDVVLGDLEDCRLLAWGPERAVDPAHRAGLASGARRSLYGSPPDRHPLA